LLKYKATLDLGKRRKRALKRLGGKKSSKGTGKQKKDGGKSEGKTANPSLQESRLGGGKKPYLVERKKKRVPSKKKESYKGDHAEKGGFPGGDDNWF